GCRLDRSVASLTLRTLCVFWKRGWAEDTKEVKMELFAMLRQTKDKGGQPVRWDMSAKALLALVTEFGSTKATSLGLPLEFFRETHTSFDDTGLDQVLVIG
ncbi:unnamed protein product, partial [Discosporangium mesarthrocarpum]